MLVIKAVFRYGSVIMAVFRYGRIIYLFDVNSTASEMLNAAQSATHSCLTLSLMQGVTSVRAARGNMFGHMQRLVKSWKRFGY